MNRTEIIEKIIERFKCEPYEAPLSILKQILSEELPDFQRIDEERFKRIYASKVCDIGLHIKEYNSTLPPALVRLPKATPYEFVDLFNESHSPRKIWEWLLSHYGTPEPKPSLPTVEELAKEIAGISVPIVADKKLSRVTAEYIIDKYSLHNREWWQDLKEGDKFINHDGIEVDYAGIGLLFVTQRSRGATNIKDATPYTITADEIIAKYNLSEEEVRVIREGKG